MHLGAESGLEPAEVWRRIRAMPGSRGPSGAARAEVRIAMDREPPKIFLLGAVATPPAAAEIAIHELKDRPGARSDIVLRLMWGPLPAPFPRALFGVGIVAAATPWSRTHLDAA